MFGVRNGVRLKCVRIRGRKVMPEAKNGKSKKYAGVYWRQVKTHDGLGTERMYYIIYKRGGRGSKKIEEPVGRASEGMSEALANRERAARIAGKPSNVEKRKLDNKEATTEKSIKTFEQLWEIYREDHIQNASIQGHIFRYNNHLAKGIGKKDATEITTADINSIRKNMETKKLSAQTIKHGLTLIRTVLNYAIKIGAISIGQLPHFDMPKVDNIKTENMTAAQLHAYFKAIDEEPDQDAASFLRIALLTGMRRGALMALKWDDINFEQSLIRLRGESAKNGKTVHLPLNQQAIKVFSSLTRNSESEYVFPGKNGKQRKVFQRIARRVRDKAGLPKSFRPIHGLRHCYASWMASSGKVDMYSLQKLLTHQSPQMTQRYAHLHDEALKKGANVAGEIFDSMDNG